MDESAISEFSRLRSVSSRGGEADSRIQELELFLRSQQILAISAVAHAHILIRFKRTGWEGSALLISDDDNENEIARIRSFLSNEQISFAPVFRSAIVIAPISSSSSTTGDGDGNLIDGDLVEEVVYVPDLNQPAVAPVVPAGDPLALVLAPLGLPGNVVNFIFYCRISIYHRRRRMMQTTGWIWKMCGSMLIIRLEVNLIPKEMTIFWQGWSICSAMIDGGD